MHGVLTQNEKQTEQAAEPLLVVDDLRTCFDLRQGVVNAVAGVSLRGKDQRLLRRRSFFGVYTVARIDDFRTLQHGTTTHGAQSVDPDEALDSAELLLKERSLTSYYDEVALRSLQLAANDATRGHAQASRDLTEAERQQIVDFEMALFTAQVVDFEAGSLNTRGANGGPQPLSQQPFFVGIKQPDRDLHGIAKVNFAQVPHVAFGGEGRAVALLQISRSDAEMQPEFIDGPVHHHIVIGHVQVAVVVDPARFDLHYGRNKRSKEQRFEVEAIKHSGSRLTDVANVTPTWADS